MYVLQATEHRDTSENGMSGAAQSSDGGAGQDTEADGETPHEAYHQGVVEGEEEAPPAAKQPRLEQEDVGLDLQMIQTPVVPSADTCGSQGAAGTLEEGEAVVFVFLKHFIKSDLQHPVWQTVNMPL